MYKRQIKILKFKSFFLFGPRGCGKTWLLQELFKQENCLWIDLLEEENFLKLTRRPGLLRELIQGQPTPPHWVVIDEVQRVPSLLNEVHKIIEEPQYHHHLKFALTGSSARKLKRGGANLLAGRALLNYLHPLTPIEWGQEFSLAAALNWGCLPAIVTAHEDIEKSELLKAYVNTYIREEIREEQIIRKIDPFLRFLEVAASTNGEILNFSKIARQIYSNVNTVQRYYQILEDTLLGFFLEAYHRSVRKRQIQAPKFYLFDIGVQRAIANMLSLHLTPSTYGYGKVFEHFVILEARKLNDYYRKDFRFFYYHVDGNEIDLVVERPGQKTVLIEIKSTEHVDESYIKKLSVIGKAIYESEKVIFSQEKAIRKVDDVLIFPWAQGLEWLFEEKLSVAS